MLPNLSFINILLLCLYFHSVWAVVVLVGSSDYSWGNVLDLIAGNVVWSRRTEDIYQWSACWRAVHWHSRNCFSRYVWCVNCSCAVYCWTRLKSILWTELHSSFDWQLLSTHTTRQGVDISFTVCLFFCVCLYGYGFLCRG